MSLPSPSAWLKEEQRISLIAFSANRSGTTVKLSIFNKQMNDAFINIRTVYDITPDLYMPQQLKRCPNFHQSGVTNPNIPWRTILAIFESGSELYNR